MRIAFFATAPFAIPALHQLACAPPHPTADQPAAGHHTDHHTVRVYTQPPRRGGRGQRPRPTPVHDHAESLGLDVVPATLTSTPSPQTSSGIATRDDLIAFAPDLGVVVAFGALIPPWLLALPPQGFVNLHPSLLPRWRGAAPIQRAILHGDTTTGVCVIRLAATLDTGPLLAQEQTPIHPRDTAATLAQRLATQGARLLSGTVAAMASGRSSPAPRPQSRAGVCYAAKINKKETAIDWQATAVAIDRQIRAFSPSPGAWSRLHDRRVKILSATMTDLGTRACMRAGTIVSVTPLVVACGPHGHQGLCLEMLQQAGRKPLAAAVFVRGMAMAAGDRFQPAEGEC